MAVRVELEIEGDWEKELANEIYGVRFVCLFFSVLCMNSF